MRAIRIVTVTGVLLTSISLALGPAIADGVQTTIVSANPADNTPDVMDGQVNAIAEVGDEVIAVGRFTSVRDDTGQTYSRTNIFAFSASTGAVSTTFTPTVDREVFDVAASADGQSVWIAGKFTSVDGVTRTRKLARIGVDTGEPLTSFKSPSFDKFVTQIVQRGSTLYVGGHFSKVAGQPRELIAALNPDTGRDLGTVNFDFGGTWNGGTEHVESMDMTPDGSRLVAVGNWLTVNGQSRPQVVMIDIPATGSATLDTWATTRFTTSCARLFDTYMRGIAFSPDGQYFVIVATGAYSGGPGANTLCDTSSRWETNASGPGQQPTWVDYTGGDTQTAVIVTGAAVYTGGHMRWENNPFMGDAAGPGAVPRQGLAALDPRNGLPLSWNPGRGRGHGVFGFLATDQGLWLGSDTNLLGGEWHNKLGFFPVAGGAVIPPDNTGTLPGEVYSLGTSPGSTVVERTFDGTIAGAPQTVGDGGITWSDSRGAVMIDDELFTGWSDGTLKARTYDGTTFGPSSDVNLYGLTAFASEVSTMTGMFFDKGTGRLYYTLAGQSELYCRYFTPQSQIVGALRFNAVGNGNGIDWSHTSGMFLAGGALYVGNSTNGQLLKVGWDSAHGQLTGNATAVSGPGIDANDYRARGMFLYAG